MDYLELFNAQLRVLKEADYSHLLLKQLEDQQIEVLAKINKTTISKSHIPFLPVLPMLAFRFSVLMPQLLHHPSFGDVSLIRPKQLRDLVTVPQEDPYYIFGVDNGVSATRGKSPKKAKESFEAEGRRGLTLLEGLALFMHCSDLPQNYCLWTLSSSLSFRNQDYYVALPVQRHELQKIHFIPNLDSQVSDFGPNITPSVLP